LASFRKVARLPKSLVVNSQKAIAARDYGVFDSAGLKKSLERFPPSTSETARLIGRPTKLAGSRYGNHGPLQLGGLSKLGTGFNG
jgi:hypothetical protein